MSDPPAASRVPDASDTLEVRFVGGDAAAFEELFRRWQAEVFRWVRRLVRDQATAEEVTVEAFWRAYRSRARFDPSRSFGAWMRKVAANAALDALERSRTAGRVDVASSEPVAADATRGREIRESVAVALGRLTPTLRVTAVLALVEERPYAEIADALGISVAAVKVRVFRATRGLQRELDRLGIRP
jgi:RNA polymerase sigma-70 factor (ECF subfamily)